jgi:uncharacterized protein
LRCIRLARPTIGLFSSHQNKDAHNSKVRRLKFALSSVTIIMQATLLLFGFITKALADSTAPVSIAIVIDDLGHHYERGKALVDMPYPLTLSFLPGRKYTLELSKRAYLSGKEVMLHAPMENTRKLALGFGGLTSDMDKLAVQRSLQTSIVGVPHLVGLNNHMGSALTQNPKAMSWVMELVASYPLYFLDSKTSADSVAASTARRYGIPTMVRDVFLDHEQTSAYVEEQFEKLLNIAQRKGQAIAIAHPHKITIEFLNRALPTLGERGITIATASGLWQMKHPNRAMFPRPERANESNLAFSGEF